LEYTDPYIREIQAISGVPDEGMRMLIEKGANLSFPAMEILNTPQALGNKTYYFSKGIIREFYIDKSGNEHTMRFQEGPGIITPTWTEHIINSKTIISSQALTQLDGICWHIDDFQEISLMYPQFYKVSLNRIILALHKKNVKEIRRHQFSATERYLLFLEDYPGLVNQVSLKYIASYLHITPETISRIRADISKNA